MRVLAGLAADENVFDAKARSALGERGLPSTPSLLTRYLEGSKALASSILDREVTVEGKKRTLGELRPDPQRDNRPRRSVTTAS